MSQTKEGAIKAREANYSKYGRDFYKKIGSEGGKAKVPKGFGKNKELARTAGSRGGTISKRGYRYVDGEYIENEVN